MRILITYFFILFCFPQQSFRRMKKKKTIGSMSINIVFIQIQYSMQCKTLPLFPFLYLHRFSQIHIYFQEAFKTYALRASKLFNSFIDFCFIFLSFSVLFSFALSGTQILTRKYLIYQIFFFIYFFHSFSLSYFDLFPLPTLQHRIIL